METLIVKMTMGNRGTLENAPAELCLLNHPRGQVQPASEPRQREQAKSR